MVLLEKKAVRYILYTKCEGELTLCFSQDYTFANFPLGSKKQAYELILRQAKKLNAPLWLGMYLLFPFNRFLNHFKYRSYEFKAEQEIGFEGKEGRQEKEERRQERTEGIGEGLQERRDIRRYVLQS